MKVGDLVKAPRITYDMNGERWCCEEVGAIIRIADNDVIVVFVDGETQSFQKNILKQADDADLSCYNFNSKTNKLKFLERK